MQPYRTVRDSNQIYGQLSVSDKKTQPAASWLQQSADLLPQPLKCITSGSLCNTSEQLHKAVWTVWISCLNHYGVLARRSYMYFCRYLMSVYCHPILRARRQPGCMLVGHTMPQDMLCPSLTQWSIDPFEGLPCALPHNCYLLVNPREFLPAAGSHLRAGYTDKLEDRPTNG